MKKIIVLFSIFCSLLLPCITYFAADSFVIDVDYDITDGFLLTRNKLEIFNEENVAPGDSFRYDIHVNNLSEHKLYFYLLRIEELENSADLDAFTFGIYEGSNLIFKKNYKNFTKSYIAALDAKESKAYSLEVTFEPWATNEYQRTQFNMGIVFGVQDELDEEPEEPEKPDPQEPDKPVIGPGGNKKPKPPNLGDILNNFIKTGQDFKIYYLLLCLCILSILIFILLAKRRRKGDDEKSRNTGNSSNKKEKK